MVFKGVIGFRFNGCEKLTYNDMDSHPEHLGRKILRELKCVRDWDTVRTFVGAIIIKDQWQDLSGERGQQDIADVQRKYPKLRFRNRPLNYSHLLKPFRGTLKPYLDGKLTILADGKEFFKGRYFCHWAYITNLDSLEFEIWNGRQQALKLEIREGDDPNPDRFGLYPCAKVKAYSLNSLPSEKRMYRDLARPPRYPTR